MAGHPGKNGTLKLVSCYYWWPRMAAFVASYVEGCDRCQRYRQDRHPATPVLPQEVPEGPWQTIGVDIIVSLPESKGKNAILTVVDHYTKQVHLYPMTDGLTALGVANIYFHDVFPLHGIPKKIISNRSPQFASRIMRSILKQLNVDAGLTMAYHLQANGQTERKNQEIEQYLRMFIDTRQDNWMEFIPTVEFVLNSCVSSVSGHMPFELLYSYTLDFMVPTGRPLYMPAADRRLTSLHEARKDTEAALCLSKERMKTNLMVQQRKHYTFKVRDKVWLQAKEIKIHVPSQKLGLK